MLLGVPLFGGLFQPIWSSYEVGLLRKFQGLFQDEFKEKKSFWIQQILLLLCFISAKVFSVFVPLKIQCSHHFHGNSFTKLDLPYLLVKCVLYFTMFQVEAFNVITGNLGDENWFTMMCLHLSFSFVLCLENNSFMLCF